MRELTKSEARKLAKENATPLNELIRPSDVQEGADSWEEIDDETIEHECFESASIILSERQEPAHSIAHDLALTLWAKDLPRAPMEDLVFTTKEKAVREGYWPNKMDKWHLREILEEMYQSEEYYWYYEEAREVVESGIVEGMKPE